MSIFLLELEPEDRDGFSSIEYEHGYFESREEAQAFIDERFREQRERAAERWRKYREDVAAWKAKDEELRAIGGKNAATYPYRPQPAPTYDLIEVEPGVKYI